MEMVGATRDLRNVMSIDFSFGSKAANACADSSPFAPVNGDRLFERGRSTVVKIRAGIANSPQWRGAPLLAVGFAVCENGHRAVTARRDGTAADRVGTAAAV